MSNSKSQLYFHLQIFIEERFAPLLMIYRRLRYGYPFRRIPLTKGRFAIVDPDDYTRLNHFNWYAAKSIHTWYAIRSLTTSRHGKRKNQYMHHLVIAIPAGCFADHINHNGLDNRKANLRPATLSQNIRHRRKFNTPSRSKFKGLTWRKKEKAWHVRITVNDKRLFLGSFKDELEAARTYDSSAKLYYGDYASLNFPKNNHFSPSDVRNILNVWKKLKEEI